MKFVKIFGAAALVIMVITLIFAFVQPEKGHTEKSIVINAPVEVVFSEVNTYKNFTAWSPWAKMDDGVKYTYDGPDSGAGTKLFWEGKSIGKGSQWIEASIPHTTVRNVINFEDLSGIFYLQYNLTPEGSGTRLTWVYDGENKGFAGKFKWLFMKGPLNTQFEEGLHDLKYFIEKKAETKS
jgi:hypothetical protein